MFYTKVISEVLRPAPDEAVVHCFETQPRHQLFTTAVNQAEILYGITLLPDGSRRRKLLDVAQAIFEQDLEGRVLGFTSDAAAHYADIGAARKSAGRPISQFDAVIAAIARLHGGRIVTRNVSDFEGCGIRLINPWGR